MNVVEVLAADVGGTFTDVIVERFDGSTAALKLPSTRAAYDEAILAAADELAPGAAVRRLAHGTTVATNALLERKGARTALITTEGFRDVLELARLRRPALFDLTFVKPLPLVPRDRRLEIRERTAADGTCLIAPSREQVASLVANLVATDVEAVAVCLLNAHANPRNEQLVRDWVIDALREQGCQAVVTASSDIQREIREFERTSTAVINSYLAPTVSRYLDRLREGIERQHGTGTVQIMQSNGSLIPGALAARFPCRLIESGPAAGVLAAAELIADVNDGDAIAFDMGGTTAKAALIEGGQPFETVQLDVGGAMNRDGASMSGSGYVIRAPSLDISEVGAGGGSIVWLDRTRAPRVGPESAGAEPGPACYGRGGVEPTVTDANLVLGFLSPDAIAGGRVTMRRDLAEKALNDRIAVPLDVDLETAAWGVHSLANVGMEAALRAVSVERGRSPAKYVLVAYGGAGPMHAATMAASFGMTSVVIPPRPGLLCAAGLMSALIRQDAVVAYPSAAAIDATTLRRLVAEVRSSLERLLSDELPGEAAVVTTWRLAVRYVGQPSELMVALDPAADLADEAGLAALVRSRFMAEHERTYGYADAYAPMEVVSVRGAASGRADAGGHAGGSGRDTPRRAAWLDTTPAEPTERRAYFGPTHGWLATPVHRSRRAMDGRSGPLLLEEPDSTTVVPPDWTVVCDERDRLLLTRKASSEPHTASSSSRDGADPLDREVILHGLRSIAHEMAVTVAKCAISQVVRDSLDFSTAVFDAGGRTVAQGLSIPLHLGAMPAALEHVRASSREPARPGDVFLLNDPDQGGMHLPDVFAFRPVFAQPDDVEPALWVGCVAHHADVGGRFPGSNAVGGTHIYEEGIQLPPMRVVRDGVFDDNVRRIIERNVRTPSVVWTDLSAQLAALADAEQRCRELVTRHGVHAIEDAIAAAVTRTRDYVRQLVTTLPDGSWTFTDHIDGDFEGLADDLPIVCRLTIDADQAIFDFTGSAPQVPIAINATESFTRAAVLTAFLAVFDAPELELNQGLYEALEVRVPSGTILAGTRPAPRAARGITGFRTIDVVLGVLASVVPGRVMAAGDGGATMLSVGVDAPDGSSDVLVDFLCGAWGGRPAADGLDGASALGANLANVPVEELEAKFPVRFVRYALVPNSGGDGQHRGGLASVREFEFLGERGVLSIRSDRRRHPPYGLSGGAPGAPSENWLNAETDAVLLPTKGTWQLSSGDVVRHVTAGGGGYGLPADRAPGARRRDLTEGKVVPVDERGHA